MYKLFIFFFPLEQGSYHNTIIAAQYDNITSLQKAFSSFGYFFIFNIFNIQLISYKRYLECTLFQWRLSIYPISLSAQVAVGTFFMKSPVCIFIKTELQCRETVGFYVFKLMGNDKKKN